MLSKSFILHILEEKFVIDLNNAFKFGHCFNKLIKNLKGAKYLILWQRKRILNILSKLSNPL